MRIFGKLWKKYQFTFACVSTSESFYIFNENQACWLLLIMQACFLYSLHSFPAVKMRAVQKELYACVYFQWVECIDEEKLFTVIKLLRLSKLDFTIQNVQHHPNIHWIYGSVLSISLQQYHFQLPLYLEDLLASRVLRLLTTALLFNTIH